MHARLAGLAASLLIGALLPAACGGPTPRPVRLTHVEAVAARGPEADGPPALRAAAAALLSPQETHRSYGAVFDYLGRQVGRPVELVQRRTYQETYDLLRYGSIDLGLVCTYVYVKGQAEFGLQALAAPVVGGRASYHSLVIVPAESGVTTFAELAGRRFAFTDPLSTSGRLYPLALLRETGIPPDRFFASTINTYGHDNSIRAVLQGVVDGAAVDSLVYDQWAARNPRLQGRLKVIARSPAFASPPFVAGPHLDRGIRRQVQEALQQMHLDPQGQPLLRALGVDRFVAIDAAAYDSVRENAARAGVTP